MNSKLGLIGLVITVAALSGCAGMSSDECMASDWTAIGYEDGSRGLTSNHFAEHRKACAKHGVKADFTAYQNGRDRGLVEYCQPGRGFSIGANGGRYYGVCDVQLEGEFLDAYNTGNRLYTLRSNVNRANSSINSKKRELDRIGETIIYKEAQLITGEMTTPERVQLVLDIKNLSERTGVLESEINELYDVRARSQAELDHYQLVVADMGY